MKRHLDPGSLLLIIITKVAAFITIVVLFFIIAYLLIRGIPNLTPSLFEWEYTTENVSMMPAIINTIYVVLLSLLISAPIGICSAIYLVEYANNLEKFMLEQDIGIKEAMSVIADVNEIPVDECAVVFDESCVNKIDIGAIITLDPDFDIVRM